MNWNLVAFGMAIGVGTGAVLGTVIGQTPVGLGFGTAARLVVGLALQLIGGEWRADSKDRRL